MAENMTGMDRVICGGREQISLPFSSRSTLPGFLPRETCVSIGSRSGSIEGLVTCEALSRSLSQYTGSGFGFPMEERSTPALDACL